jgi:fatty acid synthase subunit alpha
MVDAKAVQSLRQEQQSSFQHLYQALGKIVQSGASDTTGKMAQTKELWQAAEKQLDIWRAELGEDYLAGISPKFDRRRARVYNSWWNWGRVDIVAWLLKASTSTELQDTDATAMEADLLRILNRSDASCSSIVDYAVSLLLDNPDKRPQNSYPEYCLQSCQDMIHEKPLFRHTSPPLEPRTSVTSRGIVEYKEVQRTISGLPDTYCALMKRGSRFEASCQKKPPFIHLRRQEGVHFTYKEDLTLSLLKTLEAATSSGVTFAGKTVLITGAGVQSIGAEIVRGLLTGGARVIVTTSRSNYDFYRSLYRDYCGRDSELIVFPFNQASKQDCEMLISHLYAETLGTAGDIDCVVPFAAISENGREIDGLDGLSEVAHRAMLVNLLRLLGCIKQQKVSRGYVANPTHVILPLSPNHGTFGGDGLYSESKIGLETLFNRFQSEGWSDYLTICGAVIGWTRGTGLMSANNIVAQAIEAHDVVTFSQSEMALNILLLMTSEIIQQCEDAPIYADLGGGMQQLEGLKELSSTARRDIQSRARTTKAITAENEQQQSVLLGSPTTNTAPPRQQLANIQIGHPTLPEYESVTTGTQVAGELIDLKKTIVVVGYSELGPWGSARTRWEMEHARELSLEGYIEMAWIMGLVKHLSGNIQGTSYVGWVDAKSGEPVQDSDFKDRYGPYIKAHAGLRFVEPELFDGYDPASKEFLQEVVVEEDLPVFQAPESVAQAFKLKHGDKVIISPKPSDEDEFDIQFKSGARFLIPRSQPFNRLVAGQLPTGWNPKHYGISDEISSQVDPITLYVLCCVTQAMLSAGIKDPYELYRHVHVSEIANCIGTGAGGLLAMRGVYRDRYLDRDVQSDILQESFANAMDAWVNMLLLGAAGPIKSPSGTCATALESLDIACEAIQCEKAKVAIVGGTDDLQEEMSYEFANMKATANTVEELAHGRAPSEISRPTASSRAGFVESAGCGVQVLMSAELALEMGLPIHGIVAYSQMAGDKVGRSVPAPGKGVMTAARESASASLSPLLDSRFRQSQFDDWAVQIQDWRNRQMERASRSGQLSPGLVEVIENATANRLRDARNLWGLDLRRQNSGISPIRAALAAWGLDIDDIGVATFHGTSTQANDKNESEVINTMMDHLGRSKGNPILVVCQKHLTGHPKGAAGAWMLNGGLQILQSGIVPGNKNADDVDSALRRFEHLIYPAESIITSGVKAFMLTSFGFGQKGGLMLGVAPRYVFGAIDRPRYEAYRARCTSRMAAANRAFIEGLCTNSLFQAKSASAWSAEDEALVFLDPFARVSRNGEDYAFDADNLHSGEADIASETCSETSSGRRTAVEIPSTPNAEGLVDGCQKWVEKAVSMEGAAHVGVDIESVLAINIDNEVFLERNYTESEQQYCLSAPDPRQSFAGRWAAKEAVFKSLQLPSKGQGAPLKEIEILSSGGIPTVQVSP